MDTKKKILVAAIGQFAEKGKYGTRMEEVAAKAKTNKALVYYYFSNKDNLYKEALTAILYHVYSKINSELKATEPTNDPVVIVKSFLSAHFKAFSDRKSYTKIILDAHSSEPEVFNVIFKEVISNWERNFPRDIVKVFEMGKAKGIFRDINYEHIMISIFGMNLVYFFGKAIAQTLLGLDVKDEHAFLAEREQSNIDLLFNGILVK